MTSGPPKVDRLKTIDVHTHIMFPGEEGGKYAALMPRLARDEAGQEVIQIRGKSFRGQLQLHNPKLRIQDMDKKGIDMQALSIMPLLVFYDVDPDLGIACSQIQNNAIAAMVNAYPD